jgi:sugar-specific transcriptional regulator TrmB
MSLVQQIQRLGLSDKESKVYIALLELGQANAQQLAIKSGINRATTYVILDNLMADGLVSVKVKDKKSLFTIGSPEQILDMLSKAKREIEGKLDIAKMILPDLDNLAIMTNKRAMAKFYDGKEGISLIQKDILKTKPKRVDSIWNINLALEHFPHTSNDHRQKIVNKKKRQPYLSRTIVVFDQVKPVPKLPVFKKEERKYLPLNKFHFYSELVIYDNKVAIVDYKNKIKAIVIDNKNIAESMRSFFELAWLGASNYQAIKN